MRLAILEDDASQLELISRWLQMAGHHVHAFDRGTALLRALEHETFDALLLDWNVPDVSGLEVLKRLRHELGSHTPVLFSTARTEETDVVSALRQGADGYLVKPLRRLELLARLDAVTRRNVAKGTQAEGFEIGVFRVDAAARRLLRSNEVLALTAKDFDLAVLFLRNLGRLLSRGHLWESVWNARGVVSSRTIDTHVSRIRGKLLLLPEHGWRLAAVYGYGYRLEQLSEAAMPQAGASDSATKEADQPVLEDALGQRG
jgi:two-component system, OmpR family, response regulator RegX3